jgi:hypothetical protein
MSTYVINPTAEQEKLINAFLKEQQIPFFKDNEEVPDFVMAEIDKSREQVKAGHFITHEEFVKRLSFNK